MKVPIRAGSADLSSVLGVGNDHSVDEVRKRVEVRSSITVIMRGQKLTKMSIFRPK